MARSRVLDEIRGLDPERDHQRIILLSARVDFPFDTTRALEFALFRTYCVPSISGLLDRTGEFRARPQRRYDDTDVIVSELMEHGYESDRGRAALRRMNRLHGRFDIPNEDFLYVLSTFVLEPIRWNERFGWRRLCDVERLGYFHFWRAVGLRMGIRDVPADLDAYDAFNRDFERRHFRFAESNRRVGEATRELFVGWFPRALAPAIRSSITAMLDDPLIEAFGFDRPSRAMRRLVPGALRLRARLLRLAPRRRRPLLRTETASRSYPDGYDVARLGPPGVD
jgi:hypothetical protein